MENNAIKKVNEAEKLRAERDRKRQQKKRIKEFKKDERAKATLAYRRERSRQLAEIEEERKKKREEERRIKEERKREKISDKENRKKIKAEKRQRKKASWRKVGGLRTAVVALSVVCAITLTALIYTLTAPTENDIAMDSLYEKSYYDTVTRIDSVDTSLSKAIATTDKEALQKYLVEIAINCELAENDINQLPLQDESKFYTTKLINQIGDYAKYLNNKLIDGENLSVIERDNLIRLYNANLQLKDTFQGINQEIATGYSFLSLIEKNENNIVVNSFNQLQNLSVEYPELIYDGPFSDGRDEREVKGLSGKEISEDDGKSNFVKTFGEYGLSDIKKEGESTGSIETYNYSAKVNDELLYAQFSKIGGKLLMFAYSGSCNVINYTREEAEQKASDFLIGQGLENMTAVWINLTANVYTINFAFTIDDIVVYSDLIKVRVCAETGLVIGFEGTSYYLNHTDREIVLPSLLEVEARKKVSENIVIETSRLCIVPIGNNSEKMCYEFSGRYNGSLYYVYIDGESGKQVEMFKVIDSLEGELLV